MDFPVIRQHLNGERPLCPGKDLLEQCLKLLLRIARMRISILYGLQLTCVIPQNKCFGLIQQMLVKIDAVEICFQLLKQTRVFLKLWQCKAHVSSPLSGPGFLYYSQRKCQWSVLCLIPRTGGSCAYQMFCRLPAVLLYAHQDKGCEWS